MAQWILKNDSGIFNHHAPQPDGFKMIGSLENSFYIAECDSQPNGDFVVEFPEEFYHSMEFYIFPHGKRLLGVNNTNIPLSEDVDKKNRRAIIYTDEHMIFRISLIKWLALNVWIPDKTRMLSLDDQTVSKLVQDIQDLNDDILLKRYIADNLYYDL
jgi:hypothetical protein